MIVITARGRLAHQPEVRMLANGCVCEFRLLSNRFARGTEHVEAVTFFVYDREAEEFCERTEKGQMIEATGTQETQRWTDSSNQERSSVKYRLTWWDAGARPNRTRQQQEQAPTGRPAAQRQPAPTTRAAAPSRARAAPHDDEPGSGII